MTKEKLMKDIKCFGSLRIFFNVTKIIENCDNEM